MLLDMNDSYVSNSVQNVLNDEQCRAETQSRVSFMLKPRLSIDGNQWCALYGDNLQDGVAGFGDSPDDAYADFDRNWYAKLNRK
jgi:hypothetical protein